VVGVDPAVTSNKASADTGIVVAAADEHGEYYVWGIQYPCNIEELRSTDYCSPLQTLC